MHRVRAFLFVCAGAALAAMGLAAAPASAVDHPAGVATAPNCAVIIMAGGDVYTTWIEGARTCDFPPHPWVLVGNVFADAGRGATGPVVGMNQNYQILAASGDWFQGSCGAGSSYLGNVFELTGIRVPGEEFVIFGAGANGSNEYAATNLGNVYRWDNCTAGSAWSYIGAIPTSPTPTTPTTLGSVKARYR